MDLSNNRMSNRQGNSLREVLPTNGDILDYDKTACSTFFYSICAYSLRKRHIAYTYVIYNA